LDVTKSSVITPALVVFSRLCPAGLNLVKATHGPNPLLAENRRALGEEVRRLQADLGVIWDGDGDRVLFVDNQGRLVSPSFVLGILAAEALRKNRGGKVGVDVRAGLVVRDLVTAAGGELAVFPAWAQNFKFAMAEDPSLVFCGETSGHYLFRDFFSIDDGLYAALKFLFLWEKGELQDTLARLGRKYFELPEKNIPCPSGKAPLILETLADYYRDHDYLISIIDGLSVFGEDFKFNLRQSATEPFLRLNLEAPSESRAREIITRLEEHITL
jgi:phosphomannomutase